MYIVFLLVENQIHTTAKSAPATRKEFQHLYHSSHKFFYLSGHKINL